MAYQHKDGRGSLFRNKYKEKPDQPDRKGDFLLNGILYEISAWDSAKRDGEPYLGLSVKVKQQRPPGDRMPERQETTASERDGMPPMPKFRDRPEDDPANFGDDAIPFR